MQFGRVSMLYIDQPAIYSAAFPSYAFLSGIFYWVWNAIGLPINFYTYNAFHNLTSTFALVALVGLFFQTAANRREGALRTNITLTLLALTPFVIDIAHLRPEPMGLAATIGAILAFHRASQCARTVVWFYLTAGLLLGLAVTMHPSLVVSSGMTALAALIMLLRRGKILLSLQASMAGVVVPALVVGWYLANLPQSVDMLFFEVNQRSATLSGIGSSVMVILDYLLFAAPAGASLEVKAYNAVLFGGLVISMVAALVLLLAALRTGWRSLSEVEFLCTAFFLGALLNTFIDPSGRTQLYVVMSCAAVLMVGMMVPRCSDAVIFHVGTVPDVSINSATAIAGIMVLAVLFNPMAHVSKRYLYTTPRYHGPTANALVRPALAKGDALFFTTDQFLPPFIDLVKETYESLGEGTGDIAAYWVLPYMHGRPALERQTISALVCFLVRHDGDHIVWGLRKDLVRFEKGKPKRASIRLVNRFRSYRIEFQVAEILYEFHDGYFLAGRVLSLTESMDSEGRSTENLYYQFPNDAPGCQDQGASTGKLG